MSAAMGLPPVSPCSSNVSSYEEGAEQEANDNHSEEEGEDFVYSSGSEHDAEDIGDGEDESVDIGYREDYAEDIGNGEDESVDIGYREDYAEDIDDGEGESVDIGDREDESVYMGESEDEPKGIEGREDYIARHGQNSNRGISVMEDSDDDSEDNIVSDQEYNIVSDQEDNIVSDQEEGGAAAVQQPDAGHLCTNMPDYTEDVLGVDKTAKVPIFNHAKSDYIWQSYEEAKDEVKGMRSIRATVHHLPIDIFTANATSYREMETPSRNTARAVSIAALFGLSMAGMSKGYRSGQHSDKARSGGQDEYGKETSLPHRVYSYMFVGPNDQDVQQMVLIHEELVDKYDHDKVLAVRVWKHTFDPAHSDSELYSKVMEENRRVKNSSGLAHEQACHRIKNLVCESKNVMLQMGGLGGGRVLDDHAGTMFTAVYTEKDLMTRYKQYAGENIHCEGHPLFDSDAMGKGLYNTPISGDPMLGGTHVLGPEYAFSAHRELAMRAGLVSILTGEDLADRIHPDQLEMKNYWDDNKFKVPEVSRTRMFFVVDPNTVNLFDVAMPRPLGGSIEAGPDLMALYRDHYYQPAFKAGLTHARIEDHFNQKMTDLDATERMAHDALRQVNFDDFNLTDADRIRGYRSYGQVDAHDRLVIEPVQPLREIQRDTRRVSDSIVAPAIQAEQKAVNLMRAKESCEGSQAEETAPSKSAQDDLNDKRFAVMQDLIKLHLRRMEECFKGEANRQNIAAGHVAAYDGLMEAVKENNGSASIAWEQGVRMASDDTSSFAQLLLWLGQFFEIDCKVDGRDYHLMFELFCTCFEPFTDVTFLTLLCGTKGNGKTLRTMRLMEVFPKGWIQESGAGSAHSGMNGQNEDGNGRVKIYDEMINELCDSSASDRLEYWKQILMNRSFTYTRTMCIKSSDGSEVHKTIKLHTPHDETHIMCTNWGPAFTKDGDPNDPKAAMLDRTISLHVRSNGRSTSSTSDFMLHLQSPQARAKVGRFRLFVSLVGVTRLFIRGLPMLQPDLALAHRMFDYLDDQVVVKEYNLTPPTPRKAMKRIENLVTMCVMKAVADVFMFQQSAVFFSAGKPTAMGRGQPFAITQLCDVVRQLRATPELIMMAFSQGLDHSIGTSYSGFSVMTALCEQLGLSVSDWLKKPSSFATEEAPAPSVSSPGDLVGGNQAERDRAEETRMMHAGRAEKQKNLYAFSNLVTLDGMTVNDRDDVLRSLERSRRMTSAYRLLCSQNGNSDVVMTNPIDTIEHVMRGAVRPPDAYSGSISVDDTDYLPFYSSSILAGVLQVNMFYSAENVASWCANAIVTDGVNNLSLGTSYSLAFSESHRSGPSQYDYAWLVAPGNQGHRGVALEMLNGNNTVANFDIGINVLRDTLYLLSTSDNTRRCTERPNLNDMIHEKKAFTDPNGNEFEATFGLSSNEVKKYGGIKIRGAVDRRNRAARQQDPGGTTKPRHPYSGVADTSMQRKLDLLIQGGRFPAILSSVSNKVSKCAPIRIVTKGDKQFLEANTASCVDHTRTLAESIIRCSLQPGMQDMQEPLCGNSSAPAGLCATSDDHDTSTATAPPDGRCRMLPYSMDIIGISICYDVLQRLYDPDAEHWCAQYNAAYADMHLRVGLDNIPHTSLRFVGLDAKSDARKLLSVPVRTAQNTAFEPVMVERDQDQDEKIAEMLPNLQLSLGHLPDDDEISEFLQACMGSRAMPNITGDILSMKTYRDFQLTTMSHRGFMINKNTDPVFLMIRDEGLGFLYRMAETVSARINELIDTHPDVKKARARQAGDNGGAAEARVKEARIKLISSIKLPKHLDGLRCMAHIRVEPLSKLTYHNKSDEIERARERVRKNKRSISEIGPPTIDSRSIISRGNDLLMCMGV